jgi:hypothetical protein
VLKEAKRNRELRIVEKESPVMRHILVSDIGMEKKGPEEDEAFAKSPYLLKNIRRGNTILDIYD